MGDMLNWRKTISATERHSLHLARAFVMNPEVMVLQRPLHKYDSSMCKQVIAIMQEHVNRMGLCMPTATLHLRRPRTLFFSPDAIHQATTADVIWRIQKTTFGRCWTVTEASPQDLAETNPQDL